MKISVFKQSNVMIVAQHYFEREGFIVKFFRNHEEAAKFIDMLVEKDNDES